MNPRQIKKAGLLCLLLLIAFIASWEWYSRQKGYRTYFDDTEALWADKRELVYNDPQQTTVFIGSSRIKFDLDIPTWERLTGNKAVQLAMVGSSPRPALSDLAADENFKGKLVIDVTEPLFFAVAPPFVETPHKNVAYYQKRTPTQRFSFGVNRVLESNFAFLNQDYLSLNAIVGAANVPKRAGVFIFPYFPPQFEQTDYNRQSIMSDEFVKDTSLQQMMQQNWALLAEVGKAFPMPSVEALDAQFAEIKEDVNKIKNRGGQVIFVRTPASGPMGQGEQMAFPRQAFWERLLTTTNTKGIHYLDNPATANFVCPEWSHLSPADAIIYTKLLVGQLQEAGWQFQKQVPSKKDSYTAKF